MGARNGSYRGQSGSRFRRRMQAMMLRRLVRKHCGAANRGGKPALLPARPVDWKDSPQECGLAGRIAGPTILLGALVVSAAAAQAADPPKVTFLRDVAPILN